MLSVLDIIFISIGGLAVVVYLFFKIRQLVLYRKAIKRYVNDGLTEIQAREKAYKQYYLKPKNNKETPTLDKDDICED